MSRVVTVMIPKPARHLWPLALLPLALLAGMGGPLMAAEPVVPAGRLGVGGVCRTGSWTPLALQLPDQSATAVRVWAEDADGQWVGSPPAPLHARDDGGSETQLTIRLGRPGGRVRIEPLSREIVTVSAGRTDDEAWQPVSVELPSTTDLVLVVGHVPTAGASARLVAGEDRPPEVVALDASRDRVTAPRDLDGFEAAIVCGRAIETLPAETLAAVDGWVRQGGRLVFAAGESAVSISAGDSAASGWLPGGAPRLVSLRRFGALEAFARASGLAARLPATGIEVPRFEAAGGILGMIDAFEGTTAADLPLVVRRAHGLGTITWIGIDIDQPWCADWPGCDRLVAALLGGREEQETTRAADAISRVPDLAGQLRVGLETFVGPGAASRAVPFEIIAALGILYALSLYPLDWWLVSRSGRPWLSWLSLPLLAGGFTAAAWGVGSLWGRDAAPGARTAEVLDFDAASGLIRGFSWAAVRSPANDQLDVTVTAKPGMAVDHADAAVSWFADAGTGFGGVDALVAHPSLAATDYAYGATLAELQGVPIAAAASRLFEAEWTARAADPIATSTLVRDPRGQLRGTVAHHLPFPLEGCWLLHAGWLYDVGRMEPGDTYDPEKGRGPRSLAAALTRRVAKWEADRAQRWDVGDTDVGHILRVAGLHAAAGGRSYTSLEAGRLERLDLSPLLLVDRAVLVGTAAPETRGTTWRLELRAGQRSDSEDGLDLTADAADAGSLVRVAIPLPAASGDDPQ